MLIKRNKQISESFKRG